MNHRGGPLGLYVAVAMLIAGGLSPRAQAQCTEGWQSGYAFPGPSGSVLAIAAMPNGDVVAAGSFEFAGGGQVNNIARWDGTAWQSMGGGMAASSGASVHALLPMPDGTLIAAGIFSTAGASSISNVARWNGSSWLPMGSGLPYYPSMLVRTPDGTIVAAGLFTGGVAMYTGSQWNVFGPGEGLITALSGTRNGHLLAARAFTSGSTRVGEVLRWNGGAWVPVGPTFSEGSGGDASITSIVELPNDELVAAGRFTSAGSNIARWNGVSWSPLGGGTNVGINALASLPDGSIVAGGVFSSAGGVNARGIARWNGLAWSPLGIGVAGANPFVFSLAALSTGEVIAGGQFSTAGGLAADRIAKFRTNAACCPADLDNDGDFDNGGARDGAVSIEDLLFFLPAFEAGLPAADLDDDALDPATPDGAVTIEDLIAFLRHFEAGC